MTGTMKLNKPVLFPIQLSSAFAKKLVNEFAGAEFREATLFHGRFTQYSYSAELEESGDVNLFVGYNSDDGFCLSSGPCLRKTIRPFTEERVNEFKERRMFELAEEEYFRRLREKELKAIARVHKEVFGV